MGDVRSWRESFAAGSLSDRTQSVSPVRTPVCCDPGGTFDHWTTISADGGLVVVGPSDCLRAAQSGNESSLRRSSRCYGELPLNVRGGNLRNPPGHNTRNTRCAGMCQMQHPQNTLCRRTVCTRHDVYMHRHDVYENVGERAAAIPRGDPAE